MEKPKREMIINRSSEDEPRRSSRTLALVLIGAGVVLLLVNAGALSFSDIGSFFGSLGGAVGQFFGGLGRAVGDIFGSLGSAIGRFWPVLLILLGALLLLRRGRPTGQE
jgi:hypothetical protein